MPSKNTKTAGRRQRESGIELTPAKRSTQSDFLFALDDDSASTRYAAHIPAPLRERGLNVAHRQPLVGIELDGHEFRSFRVEPERAWDFHRLEINPVHSWAVLLFDCDRGDVDRPVPMPHWEVLNESNGHMHAGYVLRNPVHRYAKARSKPREYAAAVEAGLIELLEADAGYTGVLTRNPVNPGPGCTTIWYARTEPYDLSELADWLELAPAHRDEDTPGGLLESYRVGCIGRNTYLHRWGVGRALRLARTNPFHRLESVMLAVLEQENTRRAMLGDFARPLPDTEVGYIAKSNAKFAEAHYSPERFSEIQTFKARLGGLGKARRWREAMSERQLAIYEDYYVHRLRQVDIARKYGLTQPAVSKTLRQVQGAMFAEVEAAAIADRDAEIIAGFQTGVKQADLARQFGVSRSTISRFVAKYSSALSS